MTSPSNELIRDMYAEFGAAYCDSESLCKELSIFYTLMSFKDAKDITKPRIEEKLVETTYLTLGQIIVKVKPLVSTDLQIRLDQVLEKRNYLAHQFWYDNAYTMLSDSGLVEMIAELHQSRLVFDELDREFERLLIRRREEIGVADEVASTYFERGLAGEIDPSLPSKRPLSKKQVRIVKAYEIALENIGLAQAFETDDGQFLQFCDVGLGWSNFTEVQSNWKVNEKLRQYLPASVVPRPEITEPWNYEFELSQNAVLWVTRGRTEKTYRWGIRIAKR